MLFFFNDTATTEIYTLSLHDALPISRPAGGHALRRVRRPAVAPHRNPGLRGAAPGPAGPRDGLALHLHAQHGQLLREQAAAADRRKRDRKSTRLNSSHDQISYAVFCLKKKKNKRGNDHYIIRFKTLSLKRIGTGRAAQGRGVEDLFRASASLKLHGSLGVLSPLPHYESTARCTS